MSSNVELVAPSDGYRFRSPNPHAEQSRPNVDRVDSRHRTLVGTFDLCRRIIIVGGAQGCVWLSFVSVSGGVSWPGRVSVWCRLSRSSSRIAAYAFACALNETCRTMGKPLRQVERGEEDWRGGRAVTVGVVGVSTGAESCSGTGVTL